MNSSATTAETIAVSNTSTLLHINMSNVTKLTTSNFLMWSLQVQALLDGYDLGGHIDGSAPAPSALITTETGSEANPAYTLWKRQDRLIYSALLGAITPTLQPILSTTTTAAEIWSTLNHTYAKPSRGHIQQIRQQLKAWTKGTKSVNEYYQGLTMRFDELALLGKPYDHEDQIDQILAGLPEDYKTLVDQVEGRDVAPSLTELHEKLITYEAKLQAAAPVISSVPVTANLSNHRGNTGNNNYRGNSQHLKRGGYRGHQTWQQQQFSPTSNPNTSRGYQGKCQICGVFGHSARRCTQLQTMGHSQSGAPSQLQMSVPWQPRANLGAVSQYNPNQWILDSGATHHLTSDLNNLALHQPYHGGEEVSIADGSGLPITHMGSASLSTPSKSLILNDILCVPHVNKNLLSVYRLCNANAVSVAFFPSYFQVMDLKTGVRLLQGQARDELYEWPVSASSPKPASYLIYPDTKTTLHQWHKRLGHPSLATLKSVVSNFSLPCSNNSVFPCNDCLLNKIHKLPFQQSSIVSSKPLQYVFSDVWQSPVLSAHNYKYYLVLVDHYTRYCWMYPLKAKSQVKEIFVAFKSLVENRFQTKIQTLYSDNGGEYLALKSFLSSHGISHLTTPPHTPEHNGLSERKHRHIVETGLSLLTAAQMPLSHWPYAFAAAVFLINRLPTPVLSHLSPYQKLFQITPNYQKLRTFGCLCFPWLRPYAPNKLENRSLPCVFIGYSLTQSAYLCLEPLSGRIYTSRHVRFNETQFPYPSLTKPQAQKDSVPSSSTSQPPATAIPVTSPLIHSTPAAATTEPLVSDTSPLASPSGSIGHTGSSAVAADPNNGATQQQDQVLQTANTEVVDIQSQPAEPTAASDQMAGQPNQHRMTTRSKNNIHKKTTKYNLTASLETDPHWIPSTWQQAMRHPKWRAAMSSEFNSTTENHTWDLVEIQKFMNIVGCRWVFTIKYHPNGEIDRYKARIVAKGYHQQPGVDYTDTFSPVIKSTTIRIVLGLAVNQDWPIRQIDVNTAFLQGRLKEQVFMSQPPGFSDPAKPNHVCQLKKALYGLKQAPRAWYSELKSFLLATGFQNSLADTSLFIFRKANQFVYVLVYVDDILITGTNPQMVQRVIDELANRFSIKDMGHISYFLGIEARRTSQGLHLMQKKYVIDLLTKTNMLHAKPVATPLASSPKLTLNSGTTLSDPREYRQIVGSLQYLALTRPDISYAVNRLSQFMHKPTTDHWGAVKRVLRYLSGTLTHGIFLRKQANPTLHAFSDADWAGDSDDYVSTNGYIIYLGSHPISWTSKKQQGVARSSTEAEYRSVANTAAELRWICSLLSELGVTVSTTPTVYCDNIGATYLCANPVFHSRMKHIALDYHFVRSQIQNKVLRVTHVPTQDQLADGFTKPLPRPRFQELRSKIGVTHGPSS